MNNKGKTEIVSIRGHFTNDTKLFPGKFFCEFHREREVIGAFSLTSEKQVSLHKGSLASAARLLKLVRSLPGHLDERATGWWWTRKLPSPTANV